LFIDERSNYIPLSVTFTGFNFKLLFLISAIKSALFVVVLFGFSNGGGGAKFRVGAGGREGIGKFNAGIGGGGGGKFKILPVSTDEYGFEEH